MRVTEMALPEAFKRINEFLGNVHDAGQIETYDELLQIYDPELAVALSSLVSKLSIPQRRNPNAKKLVVRDGLTTYTAVAENRNPDTQDPTGIYLEEANRKLGIKRRPVWALLSIESGMQTTLAVDTDGTYSPHAAHQDAVTAYMRWLESQPDFDKEQKIDFDADAPDEFKRQNGLVYNDFLRVTAHLVRNVVQR